MPKSHFYTRVSKERQAAQGTSIPDCLQRAAHYGAFKQLPGYEVIERVAATLHSRLATLNLADIAPAKREKGVLDLLREANDCVYIDAGVTSDIMLMQRPAAMVMCSVLEEGDHVIIPVFDRAFRSSADVEMAFNYFRSRKISVHILDLNIDTSTIMGECMLEIMGAIKRLDKRTIRERITRGIHYAMANGKMPTPPLGWKFTERRIGRYKKLAPDREYRKLADEILRLSESGMSDRKLWSYLAAKGAQNPRSRAIGMSFGAVQRARRAAKAGYPCKELPVTKPAGIVLEGSVVDNAITQERIA